MVFMTAGVKLTWLCRSMPCSLNTTATLSIELSVVLQDLPAAVLPYWQASAGEGDQARVSVGP